MGLIFLLILLKRKIKYLFLINLLFVIIFTSCHRESVKKKINEAELNRNKGQYAKAIVIYKNIIDKKTNNPIYIKALFELGRTYYFYLNDYPAALRYFYQLIYNYPNNALAVSSQKNIADIYLFKIKDFEKAIEEYNKLLYIKSIDVVNREDIIYNIAQCYFNLGNYEQARLEYRYLLEGFPNTHLTSKVYFRIATALHLQGAFIKAINSYQVVISKFPKDKLSNTARLEIARILEDQDKLKEALEIYHKLFKTYENKDMVRNKINQIKLRQEAKKSGKKNRDNWSGKLGNNSGKPSRK